MSGYGCQGTASIEENRLSKRTAFTREDDAFATANAHARTRALKRGQAVSESVRRGSAVKLPLRQVDGVRVIDLPAAAARLSARAVQQMLDESA